MNSSSFLSILLVSFPESFLIGLLSILTIGKFTYIKDRNNVIRLIVYALISATLSFFVKSNLTSEEALLIYLFLSSLLFIFVVRLRFYESILATLFGLALQIMTEIPWALAGYAFAGKDFDKLSPDVGTLLLMTLPLRLTQITLIYLSYRFKIKIVDLENKNIQKKGYYIQLVVYVISIGTLIFLAFVMTKMIIFDNSNFTTSTNNLLIRINIYLTLFVTVILTLAVRNTHEHYENKNTLNNNEFLQNLDYISSLIEEENIDEAKDAINSLKSHLKINKM